MATTDPMVEIINYLFSSTIQSQSQKSAIATYALAAAGQLLQNQKYPEAVIQLKKAVALDPTSQDAYSALGNTYLQMGKTKDAIDAYKSQIRVNPTSADAYNSLANAYLQAGDHAGAEKQYKISARMDGSTTYAPYALGNLYLLDGRNAEAKVQFDKVVKIAPKDAHGYYGLAAVANKQGDFNEAVSQATRAINLQKDFAEPHFELGTAYFNLDRKDEAKAQATILTDMDATLASDLTSMLVTPRIIASLPGSSSFNTLNQPGTLLASLHPSLLFPNTSKDFTMVFQFDSEMDAASAMNVTNWSISKASGGQAGLYNNGVTLHPETQVSVPSIPKRVVYDPQTMQATLSFTLSQNSAVSAEIDPSHIVFKFSGTDKYGKAMDPTANEVDGFGGLPF